MRGQEKAPDRLGAGGERVRVVVFAVSFSRLCAMGERPNGGPGFTPGAGTLKAGYPGNLNCMAFFLVG
jgi:hypothetical protein